MKICRQDEALLLHWEVWLATLTPPPSIFLPPPRFCSSGHHHQYSHTLRPNLSLSLSQSRNSFHKISFLPILHRSIWYSRLIHEYLISPSDSFVTNFDVSLNSHKFHISAFSSIPANFTITGTRISNSKKVKLRMVTFSEIGIQLSGKVDFPQTGTFWSIIGCLRGGLY